MKAKNTIPSNLKAMFPNFRDCIETYKKCSINTTGNKYLVQSEISAINFDRLTKWLFKGDLPKSADTLNFESDGRPCFIEFKDSNFVNKGDTRKALIKSAIGKMNDSDTTLRKKILNGSKEECEQCDFFLVVSVRDMNEESIAIILAELSDFDQEDSIYEAIRKGLLVDLKEGLDTPGHFKEVDLWYAEEFDKHLDVYGIKDVDIGA